jgi:NTE family protein
MSITVNGVEKRIGLALSGGGFRAAAFHLGTFRKLEALGLLDKIDLLSCVSGGSIAGGVLANGWGNPETLARLKHYLLTRSIAVASVIEGIIDPFESRTDKLADHYDADLFDGATLAALDHAPRIVFNGTNLATGNLFFIAAGGKQVPEMGDHELTIRHAPAFRVSRAVAASSSFPPVFPPLRLAEAEYPKTKAVDYVTLTDGGVYDNLGINPVLWPRSNLDYVIVSDAGSPFKVDRDPSESGLGVIASLVQILMEQVRSLQFDRLKYHHKAGRGPKPLWFSIDSHAGEAQVGDAVAASGVSTNLKALTEAELDVLTRHASALCESRLKSFAPELLPR